MVIALFLVAFGFMIVDRSTFSDRRRTDAGVFFRAGWATVAGVDPYTVTDENDWYFLYAPGVAALFAPLAEPPPGPPLPPPKDWFRREWGTSAAASPHHLRGFLPYELSVYIWYAFSAVCVVLSIHLLALALSRGSHDPHIRALSPANGGWWNMRFWPFLCILPDVGSTLSRGQINAQMLLCICAGIYLYSRSRFFWGGLIMAFAAFIKVFPGIMLVDALFRRGHRALAGYIVCGLLTMILLPAVVFGPQQAWDYTWTFLDRSLLAGIAGREDRLQAGTGFDNTDNLSIQGSLHNLLNINTPRGQRPDQTAPFVRPVHLALSVALLAATMFIARRRPSHAHPSALPHEPPPPDSALEICTRIGMLCCVMLMAVPMVHRHYYILILPAIFALVYANILRSRLGTLSGIGILLIPLYPLLLSLPRFQQQGILRDLPIPLLLNFLLWTLCAVLLIKLSKARGSDRAAVT